MLRGPHKDRRSGLSDSHPGRLPRGELHGKGTKLSVEYSLCRQGLTGQFDSHSLPKITDMISHVYLSAVLMFAALPSVCSQCTTRRCLDSKYEPPRWENGAVYLESLLTVTSETILSAVESRLIELTATMKTSHAQLTATMESRLAQHAEALDERLATLKTEMEHSTTSRLEALEERMVVENRNVTTNSEYRLNLTIGALMTNIESRLAEQSAAIERRLVDQTTTIAGHLAQHTEAVDARMATLKTELENATTDRLEALEERMVVETRNLANNSESRLNFTIGAMINNMEERMVVENRNVTTNSESRLNLTIGATMNSMEERIRHEIRTVSNTTEIQLKTAQTQTNGTVGAVLHGVETSLTTLCSSRGSDQLIAAVYNMSKAQLQILRLLVESRGQVTFLRRVDGSVDFQRNWAEYKSGFGDNNEFWLGLEKLHQLTTQYNYGLRVDMEDFSGEQKWAAYQSFRVGGESGNYVLTISGYNSDSTAGDSLDYHNGMAFTTVDRDNDRYGVNCATVFKGGWWYKHCHHCNPTGVYKPAGYRDQDGINWTRAYGDWRSFKSMSLKLIGN